MNSTDAPGLSQNSKLPSFALGPSHTKKIIMMMIDDDDDRDDDDNDDDR